MKIGELCRYLGCGCSLLEEHRHDEHIIHDDNEAAFFFINMDTKTAYPCCDECRRNVYNSDIGDAYHVDRIWIPVTEYIILPLLIKLSPPPTLTGDWFKNGNHMSRSGEVAKFLKQLKLW